MARFSVVSRRGGRLAALGAAGYKIKNFLDDSGHKANADTARTPSVRLFCASAPSRVFREAKDAMGDDFSVVSFGLTRSSGGETTYELAAKRPSNGEIALSPLDVASALAHGGEILSVKVALRDDKINELKAACEKVRAKDAKALLVSFQSHPNASFIEIDSLQSEIDALAREGAEIYLGVFDDESVAEGETRVCVLAAGIE